MTPYLLSLFTSSTAIPAAIPPTMLACSFRPSRICLKQPCCHKIQKNLNIYPQSECSKPTLFSPAHCCALPLLSYRGCCWSNSSWPADRLRCLLRTWSPRSRCSWWSRSISAARGRRARRCHHNSTGKVMTFRPLTVKAGTCAWGYLIFGIIKQTTARHLCTAKVNEQKSSSSIGQ